MDEEYRETLAFTLALVGIVLVIGLMVYFFAPSSSQAFERKHARCVQLGIGDDCTCILLDGELCGRR